MASDALATHSGAIVTGGMVRETPEAGSAVAPMRLPVVALLLLFVFAFVVPRFAQALNLFDVFAVPLGFFMAAQGSLIAFVIIGVIAARRQNRIPLRHATDEQGISHGAH